MLSLFDKNLHLNNYNGSWFIKKGMGFNDENLWWGECKKRIEAHEGVDFGFVSGNEGVVSIDTDFNVHNFFDGEVVNVVYDFIDRSVFVRHCAKKKGYSLYSVFGHITTDIERGTVSSFEIIGKVGKKKGIPPHYHFSLAWIPDFVTYDMLEWKTLNSIKEVRFINPVEFDFKKELL